VRLGKFMAEADSQRIFPARMHPAVIKRDELHAFSECVNDSRDGIRFRNKNDPFREISSGFPKPWDPDERGFIFRQRSK